MHALDSMRRNISFCSSSIPSKALIAPSKNYLNKEALRQKRLGLDIKLQTAVQSGQQLLFAPQPFPLRKHCVSMSLHFLHEYRQHRYISLAADRLKEGATPECAKTSVLYNQIFENYLQNMDETVTPNDFLYNVRLEVAKTLNLAFSNEIILRYPFEAILPYLEHILPSGEYLIPLHEHVAALIKDVDGRLYVFNPEHGTIDLNAEEGKKWFLTFLEKYKIHLTETLSLLKIHEFEDKYPKITEVVFDEDPPTLTLEQGEGRWGKAIFNWRGQTYHLPWDSKTGYIYNNDPMWLLRTKCILLIPRSLLDASLRCLYHVALTSLRMLVLPFASIQGKMQALYLVKKIEVSAKDIFRSLLYGAAGSCVAFFGVFKPLDGRRLYGYLERCLNRQNDHVDIRRKYYTAPCFKPCNFEAHGDDSLTIETLKRFSLQYKHFKGKAILELFFGWRRGLCNR